MTITPLAPRTPYIAVPAGSCTTSIDAISRGLMDLRLAPCAMSTGTSSTIHRGWLFDMKELTPWMRTERPPSAISVTVTPGKRSLKSCASERPGARSISSDASTEAHRKATVGSPAHLHAGKATHQDLLDRLPGCLGDVLRRHGRAGSGSGRGRRRGGGWLVPMSATGTQCDEEADRQQGAHRERDHWTPPMTRYVSIYAMVRLAANP